MPATSPKLHPHDAKVLIVDDEESLRHLLRVILEREGHVVAEAADGVEALRLLGELPHLRIALCDVRMPRMDGMAFLRRAAGRGLPVVMMSAYGSADSAVESLNLGAFDYISKPFRAKEICSVVHRVIEQEPARPIAPVPPGLVAVAAATRRLQRDLERAVAGPQGILITGEAGSGKTLVARRVHMLAGGAGELRTYAAAALDMGALERQEGGTVVIEEPAALSPAAQDALQAWLDGPGQDAGAPRLVCTSRLDLDRATASGALQRTLQRRLAASRLVVPPLRDRTEDLAELTEVLTQSAARRLGRAVVGVTDAALEALARQDWPGNVRQLAHVLEHAVLMATGERVDVADLDLPEGAGGGPGAGVVSFGPDDGDAELSIKRHSAALEAHLIELALRRTGGNRTQAARLLEISYKALAYKVRDYGLEDL